MKTAVITLLPNYYYSAHHIANVVSDSLLLLPHEFESLDFHELSSIDAIVVIGNIPNVVEWISGIDCKDNNVFIGIDPECRFIVPLIDNDKHSAIRLTTYLGGALKATVINSELNFPDLWSIRHISEGLDWQFALQGDIEDIQSHFTSFAPTALLLDVKDKGTEYFESTRPPHVDIFYHIDDIIDNDYRMIIAVTPWRVPQHKAELIVTFIPKCLYFTLGEGYIENLQGDNSRSNEAVDISENIIAALTENGIYPQALATLSPRQKEILINSGNFGVTLVETEITLQQNFQPQLLKINMLPRYCRTGRLTMIQFPSDCPLMISVLASSTIKEADLIILSYDSLPRDYYSWFKPSSEKLCTINTEEFIIIDRIKYYLDRGQNIVWLQPDSLPIPSSPQTTLDRHNLPYILLR